MTVIRLRGYRDSVLIKTPWGRFAVTFYGLIGPWLARLVLRFPVSRVLLSPALERLSRVFTKRMSNHTLRARDRASIPHAPESNDLP